MKFDTKPLAHVSASQITTWSKCARKHWLEKIAGLASPAGAGAQFGTRGHAAIEARIGTGEWPDDPEAVQVAVAGWRFIPPPPLLVEAEMSLDDGALPIVGRIDLIAPDSSVVIDHKFLSSFRYAKSPAELADDPQAILYTIWAQRQGYLRREALTFRHIVYSTRGQPEARVAQVLYTPDQLQRKYDTLLQTVEKIAATSCATHPADVQGAMESPDPSPCKAYGGCPHQSICQELLGRSIWQSVEPKKDTEMAESLMERLAKKKQVQAASVGDVNPPEAPLHVGQQAAAPIEVVAQVKTQQDLFAGAMPSKAKQPDVSFPPSDAEMAQYAAEQAALRLLKEEQAPDPRLNDPLQYSTLYIGCMPVNEPVVMLESWIAPLLVSAAQSLGVAHYGMADYGKGKPALAALVAHKASVEGVPLIMVADQRLPSTDVALEVLRPLYRRIVCKFG